MKIISIVLGIVCGLITGVWILSFAFMWAYSFIIHWAFGIVYNLSYPVVSMISICNNIDYILGMTKTINLTGTRV